MRLLVVEDHHALARSMVTALREGGYAADSTGHGDEALYMIREVPYDLVLLDLMLPGLDGLAILGKMRDEKHRASVLVLTARGGVDDRVTGLDAGADDFLVKPFAHAELMARVRALLRRRYDLKTRTVEVGPLLLDTLARRMSVSGSDVALSAREYSILEYLALRRGQVVSRDELWTHVYDFATDRGSNVLDVHISNLRRKLGPDAAGIVRTCRGLGYLLEEPK